jgi:hypothetical protein
MMGQDSDPTKSAKRDPVMQKWDAMGWDEQEGFGQLQVALPMVVYSAVMAIPCDSHHVKRESLRTQSESAGETCGQESIRLPDAGINLIRY